MTSCISCLPGDNWNSLNGLVSGKPLFTHRNQSFPFDAYLYSYKCTSHRFSVLIFSSHAVLRRWHPSVCNSRRKWLTALSKRTAGRCQQLSRCGQIRGSSLWLGELPGNRCCFICIVMQSVPWDRHTAHTVENFQLLRSVNLVTLKSWKCTY